MDRVRKEKIQQFVIFTAAEPAVAVEYLTRHDWNLEIAVDAYFSHPPPAPSNAQAASSVDRARIEALFDTYAAVGDEADSEGSSSNDEMTFAGVERLMAELHCTDPADPAVFLLAFGLHAKTLGSFMRDEFVDGLFRLRLDTLDKLRQWLVSARAELASSPAVFKEFYAFLFDYGRGPNQQRRSLDLDTAKELWAISLTSARFALIGKWLEFVEETKVRGVTKDVWMMLLEFAAICKEKPSAAWDSSSSWPTLIDDFVAYLQR
eukprot:TRINITY_DN4772_c0_g1_i1.p1 TRINITY_DN4772_c0_g1~~TRINITY_DN4772_c0_g1_i1.p1  ORF type:complete len:263 (-),score=83.74 TRINITY_DN4772_c0_g1_i1:260-1048(-)